MNLRSTWRVKSAASAPRTLVVQSFSGTSVPLDQWMRTPSGEVQLH
jgi:hypothetical protein